MTLTTNGMNYIAKEFGVGNCFAYSGLSWTSVAIDGTTVNESGGTRNIVARLATTSMYSRIDLTYPVVKSYTYANLRTANNNTDVTLIDSQWITANDGYPAGEPQYCVSGTPTPTQTPIPTATPTPAPISVYITCSGSGYYLHEENRGIHASLPATVTLKRDVDFQFEVQKPDYETRMYAVIRVDINGNLSCLNIDGDNTLCNRTTPPGAVINNSTKRIDLYPVAGTTPTPTQTPTPTPVYTPTPTVGPTPTPFSGTPPTFEFKGTPTGNPTVNLNLNTLVMRQAADYHFEMNDIVITNTSGWTVYVAMEVKLFTGALSSCPSVGYVFDGLDRTSTRNPRIKILEAGETATFDADFYQPTSILGVHTVCLLIRGTWLRTQLEAEILPITG